VGDVRAAREGGIDVIALSGEHDISNVAEFERAITAALTDEATSCLVDLAEVSFIDSAIIAALVRFSKEAQVSKREALAIVIGEPSSIGSRTLQMVGLLKRLPVFSTRELALAALGDGQKPRPQRPLGWLSDRELDAARLVAEHDTTHGTQRQRDAAGGRIDDITREQRRRDDPS
jgi:anti-sigma B factor antagonist